MITPTLEIASDRAIVLLGHTERHATGELLERTLLRHGLFSSITLATINDLDTRSKKGKDLKAMMRDMSVISHSASIEYVEEALQVVAFNPPEKTSTVQLFVRAGKILRDKVEKEPGVHKGGLSDKLGAGFEFIRGPITSARTIRTIAKGYSTVEHFIAGADNFPGGTAIIHSGNDSFGFQHLADLNRAREAGIAVKVLDNHHHNELLFAPKRTMAAVTDVIEFPPLGQRKN